MRCNHEWLMFSWLWGCDCGLWCRSSSRGSEVTGTKRWWTPLVQNTMSLVSFVLFCLLAIICGCTLNDGTYKRLISCAQSNATALICKANNVQFLIDGQRDINLPICIIKVVVCTKLRAVYNILSIHRFITFSDSVNKSGSVIDFVCVTVPS